MKLSDFINKRLKELGMKRSDLINKHDLVWSTLSTIDRGGSIGNVTIEKLALALQCNRGDIQACLAEQNPLQKVIVSKKSLAKMKPAAEPAANVSDPEAEPEEEVDMMFPPEPEAEPTETLVAFKARMAYVCLRKFAEYKDNDEAKIHIAEAVLEEILK